MFNRKFRSLAVGRRLTLVALIAALAMALAACKKASDSTGNQPTTQPTQSEPTIDASPTTKVGEQWQVITSNNVTFTVTAPGAKSVRILYRPAFAEGHVQLKKSVPASQSDAGKFTTQMKVPVDFAGETWAEILYPNGEKKQTKPISLTTEDITPEELADASYKHTEESARSDKLTGGRIEKTELQPGKGDIRITINIPAFQTHAVARRKRSPDLRDRNWPKRVSTAERPAHARRSFSIRIGFRLIASGYMNMMSSPESASRLTTHATRWERSKFRSAAAAS